MKVKGKKRDIDIVRYDKVNLNFKNRYAWNVILYYKSGIDIQTQALLASAQEVYYRKEQLAKTNG